MQFTIKETKVDDHGSLCGSCAHGVIITDAHGTRTRHCHILERDMLYPVERCTAYHERGTLDLHDMKQIGWVLETNPRQKVGFMPPKDHGRKPQAHLGDDGGVYYDNDDD